VKVTKDMLDLAKHIVTQKTGEFEPEKFEDHYEVILAGHLERIGGTTWLLRPVR
jgi:non-homologous end joining protein Ku